MGKITFVSEPDLEKELRRRIERKGDISRIINQALKRFFEEDPANGDK